MRCRATEFVTADDQTLMKKKKVSRVEYSIAVNLLTPLQELQILSAMNL